MFLLKSYIIYCNENLEVQLASFTKRGEGLNVLSRVNCLADCPQ